MIRFITIHHETDKFLYLQKTYIEKNTNDDYIVYCGYSNISPANLDEKYKLIDLTNQSHHHADRLNILYNFAKTDANEDDIIIFIDSDCYPISQNWISELKKYLNENPIAAIQRKENFSAPLGCVPELHPHPCFFATTVKFWSSNNLKFDTQETAGYQIGLWLLKNNLDFYKLLRSNTVNIHPLMFGVYNDIIYHHGAGNRPPYDGADTCLRQRLGTGEELGAFYNKISSFNQKLSNLVYDEILNDYDFIKNYLIGVK